MTSDPVQFQSAFADAYRNTVMKGCVDALAANFPAVVRLVGEQWFRAVALDFVTWQPPDDPRLLSYGRGFPDLSTKRGASSPRRSPKAAARCATTSTRRASPAISSSTTTCMGAPDCRAAAAGRA